MALFPVRDAPAALAAEDVHARRTRRILERLLANIRPRDFRIRLWNGDECPPDPGTDARFTLLLNRPSALRAMLWPPGELAAAEAYLQGEFDVEGDLVAAMRLGDALEAAHRGVSESLALLRELLQLPAPAPAPAAGRRPARLRGLRHSRRRDREAIRYHYDVGNDFYRLWLDRRMVYSCAYFRAGVETLDAAQEAKLEMICRKLRLRAGERFLDIGCGWGGLVIFAAQRYGVQALGVTLSARQAEFAAARIREAGLQDRARVEWLDYRDLPDTAFDKIASVGMFEHVGRSRLPEYFRKVRRLLRPRGVFLNHGIALLERGAPRARLALPLRRDGFLARYVFPDGELVSIAEALRIAEEAGLEVRDVESWREHYARTLRCWLDRLEAAREEALRATDERTYRTWRLYMAGAAHRFETARLTIYQTLLVRPDDAGATGLPPGREDWYA